MSSNRAAFSKLLCLWLLIAGPTAAFRAHVSLDVITGLLGSGSPGLSSKRSPDNYLRGSGAAGSWLQQVMSTEAYHQSDSFTFHSTMVAMFVAITLFGLLVGCIMMACLCCSSGSPGRRNSGTPKARCNPKSEAQDAFLLAGGASAESDQHSTSAADQAVDAPGAATPGEASSLSSGDEHPREPENEPASDNQAPMSAASSTKVTKVSTNHLTIPVPADDVTVIYHGSSALATSNESSPVRKSTVAEEWLSKLEERRKLFEEQGVVQADETDEV